MDNGGWGSSRAPIPVDGMTGGSGRFRVRLKPDTKQYRAGPCFTFRVPYAFSFRVRVSALRGRSGRLGLMMSMTFSAVAR